MAWPSGIYPTAERWQPSFTAVSSGRTLAGTGQRVAPLSDVWTAELTFLVTQSQRATWDSFVHSRRGTLRNFTGGPFTGDFIPTGSTTANAAAAAGATSLALSCPDSSLVLPDSWFGIGSRLYWITDVVETSATVATLTFYPPLRADVAAATAVDATPVTTLRFETVRTYRWSTAPVDEIPVTVEEVV